MKATTQNQRIGMQAKQSGQDKYACCQLSGLNFENFSGLFSCFSMFCVLDKFD